MRAVHWNFPVATQEAQLPGSFEKHHILVFQILRWIVGFWRPTATKIDQLVTEVLVDDPHSMAVGHGLDSAALEVSNHTYKTAMQNKAEMGSPLHLDIYPKRCDPSFRHPAEHLRHTFPETNILSASPLKQAMLKPTPTSTQRARSKKIRIRLVL